MVLNFGDADTTQKATGATSAQIDFVCHVYYVPVVLLLLLPLFLSLLSLCVSLFKGTSHNNIATSLPALFVFRSYNEVFVQTAFVPYFPSGTYYFSICDHGPDSSHAVIRDKTTFFPDWGMLRSRHVHFFL